MASPDISVPICQSGPSCPPLRLRGTAACSYEIYTADRVLPSFMCVGCFSCVLEDVQKQL